MKKLTLIISLFIISLTLASDTQYRFKVYVSVSGDDEQAVQTIDSYIKRELRLLGDVDIVGEKDDWEYIIGIFVSQLENKDGRKSGKYTIANYSGIRLGNWHYALPNGFKDVPSVAYSTLRLGAAYYSKDSLHEYCIRIVGGFDKDKLQWFRSILSR